MKGFALLVILVSVGGSYCDEQEESCHGKVNRICDPPREAPDFPESSEELMKLCERVQEVGNCAYGVRETCDLDEFALQMQTHVRSILDYLKSTCQEDNPTFKVLSNNLHCIKLITEIKNPVCRGHISEANREMADTHISPYIEDEDKKEIRNCLFSMMETICQSVTFGYYCGEEVKDAVLEIFSQVNPEEFECTAEQLEELEPIHEVLEGILIEELSMRDALERKRK